MATEIAKAYVQIVPKTEGIKNQITSAMGGDVSSAGDSAGDSFGSAMVSKLKQIIAAAGIGKIIKDSLEAGGDLQQSFGGIETLYENTAQTAEEFGKANGLAGKELFTAYQEYTSQASDMMKEYAANAYTMGISMNDYAEQAVSFGAALKSAYDGDVVAAAEAANTAIEDMADNSAKMGTDIESIQNAYQGFAKQNYTIKLMSAA